MSMCDSSHDANLQHFLGQLSALGLQLLKINSFMETSFMESDFQHWSSFNIEVNITLMLVFSWVATDCSTISSRKLTCMPQQPREHRLVGSNTKLQTNTQRLEPASSSSRNRETDISWAPNLVVSLRCPSRCCRTQLYDLDPEFYYVFGVCTHSLPLRLAKLLFPIMRD